MKREFPFRAKVNGKVVTITGRHWSGWYETNGFGVISPAGVVPIEESPETPHAFAQWRTFVSDRAKPWKRQGCFKQEPLTPYERKLKADRARNWLRKTLAGPMPARQVYALAKKAGIPARGLRRAKRRLGVRSVKVGGKHRGWGAVWMWALDRS